MENYYRWKGRVSYVINLGPGETGCKSYLDLLWACGTLVDGSESQQNDVANLKTRKLLHSRAGGWAICHLYYVSVTTTSQSGGAAGGPWIWAVPRARGVIEMGRGEKSWM